MAGIGRAERVSRKQRFLPDFAIKEDVSLARPQRIGIIGFGRIAETSHLPALIELSDLVEIVAIADSSDVRRTVARKLTGLPAGKLYADYRNMLANERLDAVDIALPHFLHERAAIDSARAGVNVIIEKPLAPTLDEADRIIQAVNQAGVQLAVIHNYIYRAPEAEALRLIRQDAIGKPFLARFEYMGEGHYLGAEGYDPDWRTRSEQAGGGALLDNAYHSIYCSRQFVGVPVERVFARVATFVRPIEVDDTALVLMTHQGGAISSVQASWSTSGGGQGVGEIHGARGSLAFGRDGVPLSIYRDSSGRWESIDVSAGDGFASYFESCFRSLIDRKPPPVGASEARLNLALIESAYRSEALNRALEVEPTTGQPLRQRDT